MFYYVPENDVAHLHIGDPAIVEPSGFDGKPVIGKVTRFSLRLDPETRNMRTEIVPAAAVGSDGEGNFVDTITNNRIARLSIKTGLTDNDRIEVTAGLSEETPVVTTIKSAPPPGTAVEPPRARENS